MTIRITPRSVEGETKAVRELAEAGKAAERDRRWSEASACYEQLVRDPAASVYVRLSALRWLGRAYLEQGNRGAAIDVLEAAVAAARRAAISIAPSLCTERRALRRCRSATPRRWR